MQRLEREYADLPRPTVRLASPEERQRILALAQDLPAIWHAPTTTNVERKQLLRFLVKDVTVLRREQTVHLAIRWQTDAVTELDIPGPRPPHESLRTSPAVVERVRELAPTHTDSEIADILNQEGRTTGAGATFTRRSVYHVRYANKILVSRRKESTSSAALEQRGDGRYSTKAAAELLNVPRATVARWCRLGKLDAIQGVPFGPYWIRLTPEVIAKLRKPAQQHTE